jgi:DNA-binding response OmpR family regulator
VDDFRKDSFAMPKLRILLVDDNDDIREVFQMGLESHGFEVIVASTVSEALSLIASEKFDILLSDLHMPDAGDGFTVVSAMRRTHPEAVTLVLSGYPAIQEAMSAILLQADEVLVKPIKIADVVETINKKLSKVRVAKPATKESVATILEREVDSTISAWLDLVEADEELKCISLTSEERTGHLPKLLQDLICRLRLPKGTKPAASQAAGHHGTLRQQQGYTVPMVVQESRILQVSIFNTLDKNMGTVDFSAVLKDVVTIADEVDSQLKEQMVRFMEPSIAQSAV